MACQELVDYLDKYNVRYTIVKHSPAYTAQEVAALAHLPGRELAKAVMVKLDGEMVMTVIPASYKVNLTKLAMATGSQQAELAKEGEFYGKLKGCELGAIPPFGKLWGLQVYACESLAQDEQIAFNAGSHTEIFQVAFEDYLGLAEPKILNFGDPLHG